MSAMNVNLGNGNQTEKLVFWSALTLTLSPWEREWPSRVFGFLNDRPANPVSLKIAGQLCGLKKYPM
jgi:hypothetical protein